MELALAIILLPPSLGYFAWTMHTVQKDQANDSDRLYQRKVAEAREFGYEGSRLQAEAINRQKK